MSTNRPKPPLRCRLFGHKLASGWKGGLPYFNKHYEATDGLGVEHYTLTGECAFCNHPITVGKVHISFNENGNMRRWPGDKR